MMLNFGALVKQHNIKIKGIIQLGSHYFQEKDIFLKLGVKNFVLVEPQKHAFAVTQQKSADIPNVVLFNCAVGDEEGKFTMQCDEVNQGQSSSLLTAKKHLEKYPSIQFTRMEEVDVKLLDNLEFNRDKYNVIVCDLQGAELKMLRGATETLQHIDAIYTEINFIEMYDGCVLVEELDRFLSLFGFKRVATGDNHNNQGWSDALYIKYE